MTVSAGTVKYRTGGVTTRLTGVLRRVRRRCVAANEGTTVPMMIAKRTNKLIAFRARLLRFFIISFLSLLN
jgi:hypothetical protein